MHTYIRPSTYQLRGFDSTNLADVERVNLMCFHPHVMKAKGYWEADFQIDDDVDLQHVDWHFFKTPSRFGRTHSDLLFAVTDQDSQAIGWIWYYSDTRHPLPQRVMTELGLTKRNAHICQVSYEKLLNTDWPAELVARATTVTLDDLSLERKGVIVEGLKQSLEVIANSHKKIKSAKKHFVAYGFTNPENIASEKVLARNGFLKYVRQYRYDGVLNNLWVRSV